MTLCLSRSVRSCCVAILAATGLAVTPSIAGAALDPSDLCRDAARDAARETGVPEAVLMAIALAESGRPRASGLKPWPWAMHHDGQGDWFDSEQETIAAAETALRSGATNIDLGCFQLNIRWHARAFASVEDMLSPTRNARYAAKFLAELYDETADWAAAAGAYHSRTPERAQTYRARFETLLAGLQAGDGIVGDPEPATRPAVRNNRFPLLQTGASAGFGSLVPVTEPGVRLVGG